MIALPARAAAPDSKATPRTVMPDVPQSSPPDPSEIRSRLRDAAKTVRDSQSLDPQVRAAVTDLLDELGRALDAPGSAPAEVAHLAESAAHLAETLHHAGNDRGLLERARDRLGEVVARAESRAPVAAGLVERLIDALAAMGI
jgi:hypothetical protein